MNAGGSNKNRIILINIVLIILATAFAIIMHAAFPAPVDEINFDSFLVEVFGFPVVAVFYFFLWFAHCAVVLQYFGPRSYLPRLELGYRFGLSFAIISLLGMQEVVVGASPFEVWGFDFVIYQFFMGLSDAIPVLLLCLSLSFFTLSTREKPSAGKTLSKREKSIIVLLIAVTFFIQRTIGHTTGIVHSDIGTLPIPTYLWSALFGVVLGLAYLALYPVYAEEKNPLLLSVKLSLLTLGANWIIFNSFIGLIFSGTMPQMLFRSGLDTAVLFITSIAITRFFVLEKTSPETQK